MPDDRLGHHAVETRAFEAPEPIGGDARVARRRREVDRRRGGARAALRALRAAIWNGSLAQVAVAFAEQVEEHDRRRDLLRQQLHARSGGMQAQLQRVEIEAAVSLTMTISPSSTQRAGSCARSGSSNSGK